MNDPVQRDATFIGQVASVRGGLVSVRLRDTPTTLVMVGGHAYRVGQIGAFLRIPLGYTNLYGVCTQVGADAVPTGAELDAQALERDTDLRLHGFRWLTLALFGEAVGGQFDRGVGQYPTVGDEVHLVTPVDLEVVYGSATTTVDALEIGRIADSDGIPASLQVSALVSRHACIVGSTGSGKSNLVAVLLESITGGAFPTARLIVIDPHGEYGDVLGERAHLILTGIEHRQNPDRLRVPYWALPLDRLLELTMETLQPATAEAIRDRVRELKVAASKALTDPPPEEAITADSPVPFSIRRLWFELEDVERATFSVSQGQTEEKKLDKLVDGDPASLTPPEYPPASPYNQVPYYNRQKRNIGRQLDLMRSRLLDARYAFLFDPADPLHPDLDGKVEEDLASVVRSWVGRDAPVTIVDVSGIPSEVLGTVVGTMMHIVYETLFWGMDLPIGGKCQPLLVIVDEAHRFLPTETATAATEVFSKIAKEGRKYGVGLAVVTQRPSEVDTSVLSQCGTMVALRVSSPTDKTAVAAIVPDDLGGLTALVPTLRTGEALIIGEATRVPSRVRIRRAARKPAGADPRLPDEWRKADRPDGTLYINAVKNWRAQSTSEAPVEPEESNKGTE